MFDLKTGVLSLLAVLALSACSAQLVRKDAQQQFNAGNYEQTLKLYEEGLARYPDSVELRTGQLTAREAGVTRLLGDAANARVSGNAKQAQQLVQRALALAPQNERALAMSLDLARDQRQKQALESARELAAKGLRERAMAVLVEGLKDAPKNPELLALQRQWELEARQSEQQTTRLAETRPISLDFREANLRGVLDVITRNSGVNFVFDKDLRQDLRSTIFLRQARLEDALELITSTNQLAYKVLDSQTVQIYPKTPEKLKEYQDLVIRAFYLSSADVRQTATLLKTMLKVREPFVDEKLNLIIVRETPETIRLAERLIALHDLSEPEVMLEVEVLEVKRASLTELGIKFPDSFSLTPLAPAGGFTLGNVANLNRDRIGVNLPAVTLNLHRDVGDVSILANPKIRTRNREKAKILIGDKLPVVTTTGSSTNSGFISESVNYVDVGLKLDVEPNIYLDDEVAIKIGLEVNSLVREIKTSGGSLVYQIGTRTASTVLRLRDGETQVLAGLISNDERSSANRLPGVGDLPVVGRLFSSRRDDSQHTEVVLSITPHIIRNIRRPDINQAEFWSGTENDLRSRPFSLPGKPGAPGAPDAAPGAGPGVSPGAGPGVPDASGQPTTAAPAFALKLVVPNEVKAGEVFSVYVNLKTDSPIRGMPIQLSFDQAKLEILDLEEGVFFKQDGAVLSKTKSLEQAQGRAAMAMLRNVAEGVKGEGTLMSAKFKALASGRAELRLLSAQAISTQPVIQPALPDAVGVMVK